MKNVWIMKVSGSDIFNHTIGVRGGTVGLGDRSNITRYIRTNLPTLSPTNGLLPPRGEVQDLAARLLDFRMFIKVFQARLKEAPQTTGNAGNPKLQKRNGK